MITNSWLAAHLRSLGADGLERLLELRPDAVAAPSPLTLGELAARLLRPDSLDRALNRLARPHIQVADALAGLPAPAARTLLYTVCGCRHEGARAAVDAVLARLQELALVWQRDGALEMAPGLRDAWPEPMGLSRPLTDLSDVVAALKNSEVEQILTVLGMPVPPSPEQQRAALLAHHGDPERVMALFAAGPLAAQRLLRHMARHNSTTGLSIPDAGQGLAWAVERALVLDVRGAGVREFADFAWPMPQLVMPAQIMSALRGTASVAVDPPRVVQVAADAAAVEREAVAAASAFLSQAQAVLECCDRQPPQLLKAGGIGSRELARLSKSSGAEQAVVRLVLAGARAAGLISTADGTSAQLTGGYDTWAAQDPGTKYAQLVAAWRQLPGSPTREHDSEGHALPALADRAACTDCVEDRDALWEAAALLGAQALRDPADLGLLIDWLRPLGHTCAGEAEEEGEKELFAPLIGEARLLGLVAHGTLSPLATPLRRPAGRAPQREQQEADLAVCARALLPPVCERVKIGTDLTAVSSGAPSYRLARLLDQVADRESRHPASVWRISGASVRRALDAGYSAQSLLSELQAVTDGGLLPQPLTYLIRDTARRHGHIRIASATTVVHSPDTVLLAELAAHRQLDALHLRLLAPTVLTSTSSPSAVLDALRGAGYAPVQEAADGTVRVETAVPRRAPDPRPPGTLSPPQPPPDCRALAATLLASPLDTLTVLRSATEQVLAPHTSRLDVTGVRTLAHAIDHHLEVKINYSSASSATSERTISNIALEPPYLYAWCSLRQDKRCFHLSRILDVRTP